MTIRTQILVGITLLVALLLILNMVRKRHLELKYVLGWLLCDIALIAFTCFPNSMNHVAAFLGIQSAINMIFFLGFVFSLVIIFSLTVALSRVTTRVRSLAQEIALQEFEREKKNSYDS